MNDGNVWLREKGGSGREIRAWDRGRKRVPVVGVIILALACTVGFSVGACGKKSGSAAQAGGGTGSNTGNANATQGPAAKVFELGNVLEARSVPLDGAAGASAVLADGAALTIPPGAVEGKAELILHRSSANIPGVSAMYSDVYIPAAKGSPRLLGAITLTLPLPKLPSGVSPDSASVYKLVEGRFLYPVEASIDPSGHQAIIQYPEVTILDVPADIRFRQASAAPVPAPNSPPTQATGYVWGPPGSGITPKTVLGPATVPAGTDFRQKNGSFEIIFDVPAPGSLAPQISQILEDALSAYKPTYLAYTQEGVAQISPANRMTVKIISDPQTNGEYKLYSLNGGYIQVDHGSATRDPKGLKETLYHELFHAVQHAYFNMYKAGYSGYWWFEATAEWAGLSALGMNLDQMVEHDLVQRYKYVLSVPIRESADSEYEGGKLLSYGYGILIEHLEKQKPGYVVGVLKDPKGSSGTDQLYQGLVDAGKLATTYREFVQEVLWAAGPTPWTDARVMVRDKEFRVYSHPTDKIGDPDETVSSASFENGRLLNRREIQPMTTRFYSLEEKGLSTACDVNIELTEFDDAGHSRPSDHALIISLGNAGLVGTPSPPIPWTNGRATVSGFGKDAPPLWVAVYNADPIRPMKYEINLKVSRPIGPRGLRSYVDKTLTYVEFHCQAMADMNNGDRLKFRLYRAQAERGPWELANEAEVGRTPTGFVTNNGRHTGTDLFEIDNGSGVRNQLRPDFFKVCLVVGASRDSQKELFSEPLKPSQNVDLPMRIDNDNIPLKDKSYVRKEPSGINLLPVCDISASLSHREQAYLYQSAHFIVEQGGKTRHFWSGRQEGKPAYNFGHDRGVGTLRLPAMIGHTTLNIRGVGADGATTARQIAIDYNPRWLSNRRAAATQPVDDDQFVQTYLQEGEAAPANVKALKAKLDKETDKDRRHQLRIDISQNELVALKLEEARLNSVAQRAAQSQGACDWDRSLALYRLYVSGQESYSARMLEWIDRDNAIETDDLATAEPAFAQKRKTEMAREREKTRVGMLGQHLGYLLITMKAAQRAGDYATFRYCGTTLLDEHAKLPEPLLRPNLGPNGERGNFADEEWICELLGNGTAELAGDRNLAASYFVQGHLESQRPAWWPDGNPKLLRPDPLQPTESKKMIDEWNQGSAANQKTLGIKLVPGA